MTSRLRKGFFAGSGSAAFSDPLVCEAALKLTGKWDLSTNSLSGPVSIAYLGTATYDLPGPRRSQTEQFERKGCSIIDVCVTNPITPAIRIGFAATLSEVDMVLVSGGNTLFAIRRWREEGLVPLLEEAALRGAVMTGGSAGAICWFDGGHSDSMDPETYKIPMIRAYEASVGNKQDEASEAAKDGSNKAWRYIRISALGLLPGLLCPHHDRTQSNGVPRSQDFDGMLLRHSGEKGIALDHWAALIVDGDRYEVFSTPHQQGSLMVSSTSPNGEVAGEFVVESLGVPAAWWKRVDGNGAIVRGLVPPRGRVSDLLEQAREISVDPLEAVAAEANPTCH
jgi:dipeptidase E